MSQLTVMVADDHPLVRDGLARALREDDRFEVLAEAADGDQAVLLADRLSPDLVLLDVRMPGLDGIQAMVAIKAGHPDARVVLLSAFDDDVVVRSALAQGASGYLTKDLDRPALCDALARIADGERVVSADPSREHPQAPAPPELTLRERNVLLLARDGWDDQMIAFLLDIGLEDVDWYLDRTVAKLGAQDRHGAIAAARAWGLMA